jgi:hypothetical protein
MKTPENYTEKISKYLNGSMHGAELQEFRKEIAANEFLADAIDGYNSNSAMPSDLNTIKSRIIPTPKRNRVLLGLVYSGIAAALILLAMVIIESPFDNIQNTGRSLSQTIIQFPDVVDTTQNNDTTGNNIIFIPEEKSLTAELRALPQKVIVPESIAPLHYNKIIKIDNDISDINMSGYYRYSSNHMYSYIGNFKVIDYRYDKRLNVKNRDIPSNFIDFGNDQDLTASNTEYTYISFLEQALEKINKKNYDGAIDDCNVILDQFPNDQNAIFYKAFCMYELNSNDVALKEFDKVLDGRINTFHEESLWYKGLIYKEEKQYAAAEKVLEEIVNDNGYYGVQAKKELDELYKLYLNE